MASIPINFSTRVCPLCSKKLTYNSLFKKYKNNGHYDFGFFSRPTAYCEEFYYSIHEKEPLIGYDVKARRMKMSHYTVFPSKSFIPAKDEEWFQRFIVLPYVCLNSANSETSEIREFLSDKLIMTVPLIDPSKYLPEQLKQKFNNLIIFS